MSRSLKRFSTCCSGCLFFARLLLFVRLPQNELAATGHMSYTEALCDHKEALW